MRRGLALLAILACCAAPAIARSQGQATACKSNLKNIGTACELYAADHAGRFPKTLAELTPNYLKHIPTCPSTGRDTYTPSFVSAVSPDRYAVYCRGRNHRNVGYQDNRPSYDSNLGLLERPDHALQDCQSQMQGAVAPLARYKRANMKYPKDLPTANHTSVLYYTTGSEYTMTCAGAQHVENEVVPFSPMTTSLRGAHIDYMPSAPGPARPDRTPLALLLGAFALVSLVLAHLALKTPRR